MPKGASPRSLALTAAFLCTVAVSAGIATVRHNSTDPEFAGETTGIQHGCASQQDSQLAQTLAALPFVTSHPEPADAVEKGAGCDVDGQVFAGRAYYWERLDPHEVVAFYQTIAAQDGWKQGNPADPQGEGLSAFLCLTKQIDGRPAFIRLYFDDSSIHGPLGDIFDVSAWLPGPGESLGC